MHTLLASSVRCCPVAEQPEKERGPAMKPFVLAVLLLLPLASVGRAGEDYYLLMFGSQSVPVIPSYTHTSATFVRVCWPGNGPCPVNATLEAHTISWMPANLIIRPYALLPEPGHNFDLHQTLRWCQSNRMRISLWGPYRISPELYALALEQQADLESSAVRYKAVDSGRDTGRVSNCIHAVANVITGPRARFFLPGFGETASYVVLQSFQPYILDRSTPYFWVSSAVGLDAYPIIYRDYRRADSGIAGPVFRLFGGERNLQASYGPPR